ncbi:hypothetical protein CYPRO_1962 [Cyclonatronum proteinivorum]|uniref:Uncharacterized protein n=1 Tax=Cyclonatronum proteinivorum TaxID=1457365 RepID=A0A345UL60_9BACT|nr:hypothetical protein CYPRO_1962 [Cyclonatronum proteinivorum]
MVILLMIKEFCRRGRFTILKSKGFIFGLGAFSLPAKLLMFTEFSPQKKYHHVKLLQLPGFSLILSFVRALFC